MKRKQKTKGEKSKRSGNYKNQHIVVLVGSDQESSIPPCMD